MDNINKRNFLNWFKKDRNNSTKKGFTLSELLITLSLLGVIATITYPALNVSYKKQVLETQLKKAFASLNQIYSISYINVGDMKAKPAQAMGASKYFEKYWAPFTRVSKICSTYSECGYKDNALYATNGGAFTTLVAPAVRTTFLTPDGFLYIVYTQGWHYGGETREMPFIDVDINGPKGPNTYGIDVFEFERIFKKDVKPYGYDKSDEEVRKRCEYPGDMCAEFLRRKQWKIDKSYPHYGRL